MYIQLHYQAFTWLLICVGFRWAVTCVISTYVLRWRFMNLL